MAIAELAGTYLADKAVADEKRAAQLRSIAKLNLSNADSEVTELVSRVKAFVAWLDDAKPEFAEVRGQTDKFAELVELSRHYEDCMTYYLRTVGVNSSTVWRWARKESRPGRYLGRSAAADVKSRLTTLLLAECDGQMVKLRALGFTSQVF
jgi:hypothetical protein